MFFRRGWRLPRAAASAESGEALTKMFLKPQHLHFVGVGGIGMSGIAEVLLELGFTISGSDLRLTATTEHLARLGATIFEGHRASNVAGARRSSARRCGRTIPKCWRPGGSRSR